MPRLPRCTYQRSPCAPTPPPSLARRCPAPCPLLALHTQTQTPRRPLTPLSRAPVSNPRPPDRIAVHSVCVHKRRRGDVRGRMPECARCAALGATARSLLFPIRRGRPAFRLLVRQRGDDHGVAVGDERLLAATADDLDLRLRRPRRLRDDAVGLHGEQVAEVDGDQRRALREGQAEGA